jgi:hypothetical protein
MPTKEESAITPAHFAKSRTLLSTTFDIPASDCALQDAAAERLVSLAAEQWFLVRA